MFPVLFSIGSISISSFGFFLAAAFLFSTFLVWRLARAHDLDEEKVLDLVILTFFGGLLGARLFFISLNFEVFSQDLLKIVLLTKYPGLSFWGGFLGGWLTLHLFLSRFKMDFAQVLDIAAVGFLGGLIFGDIGCFLGGCDIGVVSNSPLAVNFAGALGKRFPVTFIEAMLFLVLLLRIWPQAKHFHWSGKILSKVMIWLGIVKLIMENFRDQRYGGYLFSLSLIVLGIVMFYKLSRRSIRVDLRLFGLSLWVIITNNQGREMIFGKIWKSCYNWILIEIKNKKVGWNWFLYSLRKKLRRINVKPTPKDIR